MENDLVAGNDIKSLYSVIAKLGEEIKTLKEGAKQDKVVEKSDEVKSLDITDKIKELEVIKENEKVKENLIKETTTFLNNFDNFINDNKELLPESIDFIRESIESQNWENDNVKRQEIQRSIVLKASEKQQFMNSLIPTQQAKLKTYLSLTPDKQRDKANELWEIYLVHLNHEKDILKKQKLERINRYGVSTETQQKQYDEYKMACEFYGVKPQDKIRYFKQ
jgi:hypothetical protein